MKRLTPWFILLFFPAILICCQYNNEEDLYGRKENCDTSNVTYSQTIKPLLTNNCYSCHSADRAGSFGEGINLETYSELVSVANSGKLLGALEHLPGYDAMPQGGAKLDDCTIEKIKVWINSGALNN